MMKFRVLQIFFVLLIGAVIVHRISFSYQPRDLWAVQSIDTMKYSRDLAREKLNDFSFEVTIDRQLSAIAKTGANYVAIATPYDDEFLPILRRWVRLARKYNLRVWFRGNWSGWEGWFDYAKIDTETHIKKTEAFILKEKEMFEDGDIFSSCPECENGAKLAYDNPSTFQAHREFLLKEYLVTKKAFDKIGRDVASNYFSMNYDVAKVIMDRDTTARLDGIVVIDHYVDSAERTVADVEEIAERSGGRVMLGEFGAPIPDIHGAMSEAEQDEWIADALTQLSQSAQLIGINYWVNMGGSTEIWDGNIQPKTAVGTITRFYSGRGIKGFISTAEGNPIQNAFIQSGNFTAISDKNGTFYLPYLATAQTINITARGYRAPSVIFHKEDSLLEVTLSKRAEGIFGVLRSK